MNFSKYQHEAIQTAVYSDEHAIIYPALGLSNEVGEVLGKIKKILRGDKNETLDTISNETLEMLKHEIGDCLWYLAVLAYDLDLDLDDIAVDNIHKLRLRNENNTIKGDGDNR